MITLAEEGRRKAFAWLTIMSDLAREEGDNRQEASCENVIVSLRDTQEKLEQAIAEGKELLAKAETFGGYEISELNRWLRNNAADLFGAIERKDALLRKAIEVLRPLVEAADGCLDEYDKDDRNIWKDDCNIWEHPAAMNLTVGDLRRARAIAEECEREAK